MNSPIPIIETPKWLQEIDASNINSVQFDIKQILKDSLFYPSAGYDGNPIKYFAGSIHSFIYIDYSVERDWLLKNFKYKIIARKAVTETELAPNGWDRSFDKSLGNPEKFIELIAKPYCEWIIFQIGELKLSLLYMCADGVATYQALYVKNAIAPKVLAFIQPGTIHGNWTDFTNPQSILAKIVNSNPGGLPEYLINGGFYQRKGDRLLHKQPCWPNYEQLVATLMKSPLFDDLYTRLFRGKIVLWKKSSDAGDAADLMKAPSEVHEKYLINNRKHLKVKQWHNLYSLMTNGEKLSLIPNPLIFEHCAGPKGISKEDTFGWHISWAKRHKKLDIVQNYLDKLSENDWEH
jgi:hypothetical protein